jgi:4-hydroxy-tetrahydrodipicolinate reductase
MITRNRRLFFRIPGNYHVATGKGDGFSNTFTNVAGCKQIGRGYIGDELKIELIHPQQIHPGMEGVDTGDYINVFGDPEVHMATAPEIPGGIGTYASTGNYIPLIGDAPVGIVTVVDLPIPRFWTPSV